VPGGKRGKKSFGEGGQDGHGLLSGNEKHSTKPKKPKGGENTKNFGVKRLLVTSDTTGEGHWRGFTKVTSAQGQASGLARIIGGRGSGQEYRRRGKVNKWGERSAKGYPLFLTPDQKRTRRTWGGGGGRDKRN